ncbi:MAG: biotin transporter BioY [Candidatus Hydrogenedentota bacterium]
MVAGLIALGAHAKIPFEPVPMTLQTLPVLLAGYAIGRERAVSAVALYVVLGLLGAPVFTAVTLGATAGYIMSWFFVPYVVTFFKNPAWGLLAGTAFIYLCGASWLAFYLGLTPTQAIGAGVLPFLAGDMLKAVVGYKLLPYLRQG